MIEKVLRLNRLYIKAVRDLLVRPSSNVPTVIYSDKIWLQWKWAFQSAQLSLLGMQSVKEQWNFKVIENFFQVIPFVRDGSRFSTETQTKLCQVFTNRGKS